MIQRCCVCKKQEKNVSTLDDHCFHTLDEMVYEGKGEGNILTRCYDNGFETNN